MKINCAVQTLVLILGLQVSGVSYSSCLVMLKSPKPEQISVFGYYCSVQTQTDCKLKVRESPLDSTEWRRVDRVGRFATNLQVHDALCCRLHHQSNNEVMVNSMGGTLLQLQRVWGMSLRVPF